MTVPMEPVGLSLRVAGLTLIAGDEIPPEFEALAPESWKQTGTKQPKIKAAETVEDIR